MKQREFKVFRDPIHKDIVLSPEEVRLVDTPTFQRLRGINQLGTVYTVYPSARHSRFEHSIGTSWLTKKILRNLKLYYEIKLPAEEELLIHLYGLLHDITHLPFSHTLEDERRIFPRHDEDPRRLDYFIEESQIGGILEEMGIKDRLKKILLTHRSEPGYMADIVSATIGADMMDYMKRDNYFCGLNLQYDERIFRYFFIEKDQLIFNLSKEGIIRADALSELVQLLHMRYILTERVYFHHTKVASSVMIARAVEWAVEEGLTVEDLYPLQDSTLLFYLKNRFADNPDITHVVEDLESRRLYKRVYVLTTKIGRAKQKHFYRQYHLNEEGLREEREREIARALGIPPRGVAIYCPSLSMSSKRADMPVKVDGGHLVELEELDIPEVHNLLDKHQRLWKFYVFVDGEYEEKKREVAGLCEEVFGEKNEINYRALEREK